MALDVSRDRVVGHLLATSCVPAPAGQCVRPFISDATHANVGDVLASCCVWLELTTPPITGDDGKLSQPRCYLLWVTWRMAATFPTTSNPIPAHDDLLGSISWRVSVEELATITTTHVDALILVDWNYCHFCH